MDQKSILVQGSAAKGTQQIKFAALQSDVRTHNAAMGILIPKDEQPRNRWSVNLPRIKMGQFSYEPMPCLSIAAYYRNKQRYEPPLKLPPVMPPWTGVPMQTSLFDAV